MRGPNSTFTTPASATSRSSSAFGFPSTAQQQQPKRLNLEKLKEAEEHRIKAQKMLKVCSVAPPDLMVWDGAPDRRRLAPLCASLPLS